jgi:hypothetical protein
METLIENKYSVTKEKYMDWVMHPAKKNRLYEQKLLWTAIALFTVYVFIQSILGGDAFFSAYAILMTVFCIYRGFFRMKILASKQFDLLAKSQGASEWERTIKFSDRIKAVDGNTTTQYLYENFKELIDCGDCVALVIDPKQSIRLYKNRFTKGSLKELIDFIKTEHSNIAVNYKE